MAANLAVVEQVPAVQQWRSVSQGLNLLRGWEDLKVLLNKQLPHGIYPKMLLRQSFMYPKCQVSYHDVSSSFFTIGHLVFRFKQTLQP